MNLDGILLVDKPSGWTSFDVVAKIRGTLKRGSGQKVKVGHTGTLDPLATGLLIIVVGNYCKRAGEFSKLDKTYQVEMKLGQNSTTGDEEGQKTSVSATVPPESDTETILESLIGDIMQIPPTHSAIKIDGKRAYKLARAGQQFKIEPRKVRINSIKLESYDYPLVRFSADVGSGTYIRSLVADVGKELKTGAYMAGLRRTKVGDFNVEDAKINLADLVFEDLVASVENI